MKEFPPTAITFHRYSTFNDNGKYYWEVGFTIPGHTFPAEPSPFKSNFKEIFTYTMGLVSRYNLTVGEAHICSWVGNKWGDLGVQQPGVIEIADIKDDAEMALLVLQLS